MLLRPLPLDMLAVVKSELRPIGRLDYGPIRVDMAVNSPWQAYRLRSCQKEPETIRWLEGELRADDCFYDVGANVGAYSLVAFAITGGNATVVAFEPGYATFSELCRNVQLNHAEGSVIPLPIALGERSTVTAFRYSDTTAGAALHSWAPGVPGEAHAPEVAISTAVFSLDALVELLDLPAPTLLKIDVDGPELEVLRGAQATLAGPHLRSCLVELDERAGTSAEIVTFLGGLGFEVRSRHVRGGGGPFQNVIFARPGPDPSRVTTSR